MTVVFIHGAGSSGPAAWPRQAAQAREDWTFLERITQADDVGRDAGRVVALLRQRGPGHLVAHSYGGNIAVIAAQHVPDLVISLALLEPACFDLSRGKPAVEAHIAAMSAVFAAASDPAVSHREFSLRFAAGMGTDPPNLPDTLLEERVARLRTMAPPWNTGVDVSIGLPVRTLVVTSGTNCLYEEIAEALVELGAQHSAIHEGGHRVQDVPIIDKLLGELWR